MKRLIIAFALAFSFGGVWMPATALPAAAACDPNASGGVDAGIDCAAPDRAPRGDFFRGGFFRAIVNTIIFLVGAISIIMIVLSGLRYVLSGGDSAGVKNARDTLLYAVIGLVIAIGSFAIVQFIFRRF